MVQGQHTQKKNTMRSRAYFRTFHVPKGFLRGYLRLYISMDRLKVGHSSLWFVFMSEICTDGFTYFHLCVNVFADAEGPRRVDLIEKLFHPTFKLKV